MPETIESTLRKIIFQGQSGFIIGSFLDKANNAFTALGNMVNPQIDMNYILSGKWQNDHKYGEQLKFHSYETIIPKDENSIFKYIVRVCKFVGAKIGNDIVDEYGNDSLKIMKEYPELLADTIKGITLDRAKKIQETLLENEKTESVMLELEKILDIPGMRKNLPSELIKKYKSNAAEIVKKNPYILTSFRGIGFPMADRVAINIGIARDDIERKKAATIHAMSENMHNGNIWIFKTDLSVKINELIQVPKLNEGVEKLIKEGKIVENDGYYTFYSIDSDETLIAKKIIEMINYKKEI